MVNEADNAVDILIRFGLDEARAREALKDIDQIKSSTEDFTTTTKGLGKAEGEAAEHASKLHLNHRALHQIMSLIGNETAPELGHALTGALYGPIGIALAVGFAFEALQKHIAETNKELDAFATLAADRGETIKKAMDDAFSTIISDEAAAALKKRFDDMATGMERYNTATQQFVTLAKELRQIDLEKTNAQDAAANAQDENAVKLGLMTQKQAELNRINRAVAEEKAKVEKDEKDRAGELQAVRDEQTHAEENLARLQAEKAAQTKPDLIGDANAEIAKLPKNLQEKFKKAAAESGQQGLGDLSTELGQKATQAYLEEQIKVAQEQIGKGGEGGKPGTGFIGVKDKDQKELEDAQNKSKNAKKFYGEEKQQYGFGVEVGLAKEGMDAAAAAVTAAQDKVDSDNHAIIAQNDVITSMQVRIASIKTIVDAEKEYAAKIEEATKKIGDLKSKGAGMAAENAVLLGGDVAVQSEKDKETAAKLQMSAHNRIAKKSPESIITAGAEVMDESEQLKKQGYNNAQIHAIQVNEGHLQAIDDLNDLLTTMGGYSQNLIATIRLHSEGQISLANEIVELKNENVVFRNILKNGGHTTPP